MNFEVGPNFDILSSALEIHDSNYLMIVSFRFNTSSDKTWILNVQRPISNVEVGPNFDILSSVLEIHDSNYLMIISTRFNTSSDKTWILNDSNYLMIVSLGAFDPERYDH